MIHNDNNIDYLGKQKQKQPPTKKDDRFQPEYEGTLKYFDVDSRISILNSRLDVLKNLNQILMDAAHNAHASVLEWIIIVLIIAEIAIESFRAWRETYLYES